MLSAWDFNPHLLSDWFPSVCQAPPHVLSGRGSFASVCSVCFTTSWFVFLFFSVGWSVTLILVWVWVCTCRSTHQRSALGILAFHLETESSPLGFQVGWPVRYCAFWVHLPSCLPRGVLALDTLGTTPSILCTPFSKEPSPSSGGIFFSNF